MDLYTDIVALVYLLYEGDQEWVTDELRKEWISKLEQLLNLVSGGDKYYLKQKGNVLESARTADFSRYRQELSPTTPGEYTREDVHFLVKLQKMILGDNSECSSDVMKETAKRRLRLIAGVNNARFLATVETHIEIHFDPPSGMEIEET